MPSGFDYSKWDKLELSDDEDDHPGAKFIEENTLRRIKRESHERQEAERAAKVAELEKTIEAETEKLNELTSSTAGAEKRDAEKVRILGAIASARAEIEKEERERKFNADEMCYVASERSLVGAQCKPDAGDSDLDYEGYAKSTATSWKRWRAPPSPSGGWRTWRSFSRLARTCSPSTPWVGCCSSACAWRCRATRAA